MNPSAAIDAEGLAFLEAVMRASARPAIGRPKFQTVL